MSLNWKIPTFHYIDKFQGFITFIVLCCKKSILRKLEKKFNFKAARQDSLNSRVTQVKSIGK